VSTAHVDPTLPHADPVYPDSAQAAGEQGVVEVNVYVQPNGRVAKAQIVRSSGFADLDNSAMEAVLNWRFVPAARYGDPYSDWTKVEIAFRPPVAPPQPASPAPTAPASKK
jgi:protein TonB